MGIEGEPIPTAGAVISVSGQMFLEWENISMKEQKLKENIKVESQLDVGTKVTVTFADKPRSTDEG